MRYAYIDLQTNSNNAKLADVIALSIIVIENEEKIAHFDSILKPLLILTQAQEARSVYVNEEVRGAPSFVDIAPEIITLLENSSLLFFDRFSESVFRRNFREIGFPLGKSKCCYQEILKNKGLKDKHPNFKDLASALHISYNADAPGHNALALSQLFELFAAGDTSFFNAFAKAESKTSEPKDLYHHLPSAPGVYYFRNAEGEVIYVGKAIDLKKRVISHFKSKLRFERELTDATASVDYCETGNELIALLKESDEIRILQPAYNTQQIDDASPWVITSRKDAKGILRIYPEEKNFTDNSHSLSFNRESVISTLKMLQILYQLCPRFLGVERTAGSCSSKVCKGICRGEEDKAMYNLRVAAAQQSLKAKTESFYIALKGRNDLERAFVLVKDGLYLGYGFVSNELTIDSIEDLEACLISQVDTYFTNRSITQYINKHKGCKVSLA